VTDQKLDICCLHHVFIIV